MTLHDPAVRLQFDRFELDESDARLTCAGVSVPLAPTPFAVLCTLARTPRSLVTKDALLDAVWGHRFVCESVVKQAISEVRAALGDDPKQPRYIATVARRGYRFIGTEAPVQRAPAVAGSGAAATQAPGPATRASVDDGDSAIADLLRAVGASLERERAILLEKDVYKKVLGLLIEVAERRQEALQRLGVQSFARALD